MIATAPKPLQGLIEVRGVGIVRLPRSQLLAQAPLALAVDLVFPDSVERLPEPTYEAILGITLRVVALPAFEASTVTKLRLALAQTANA